MIDRVKNFFQRTNIVVILIGIILLLIIVTVVFISPPDGGDTDTPGGPSRPGDSDGQQFQDIDENDVAEPSDYNNDTEELLDNLPYYSSSFDADFLPLDPDTKPIVLVTVYTDNGGQDFLNWARQFGDIDVEVEFVEDIELHGPYE